MQALALQQEQFSHGATLPLPFQQLDHAFARQVQCQPHAIAVEHEGQCLSYQQLDQRAQQLACLLQQQGVREGMRVGLFLERSLEMVIGIVAILKCGATYVPQDARISPPAQLKHVIAVSGIRLVLTLSHLQARIPQSCACLSLDRLPASTPPHTMPLSAFNPQRHCLILFTSGTTGVPNAVAVTHHNICNLIALAPGNLQVKAGTRITQIMNIAFDMAAWEIFLALCHGATLVIRGKSIATAVAHADTIIATPSMLNSLNADACQHVQTVAVAGEPCPAPLADRWAQFCNFYNSCGPTEITIVNTAKLHRVGDAITIGTPLPNTSAYILDSQHCPCPIGTVGEIWVGGAGVTSGYLNNKKLTQQRWLPDKFRHDGSLMFRTRDLGRWLADGEIEHCGRLDDQVKIKGFRVELDAIASILEREGLCEQAVSLHIEGQIITFVRAARVGTNKMREELARRLPYFCLPAAIHVCSQFPCTARGKVDRQALTRMYAERHASLSCSSPRPALPKASRWRQLWHHPYLMPYNLLALCVMLCNLHYAYHARPTEIVTLLNIILVNFSLALLLRQQYVINFLFHLCTALPHRWPLAIRRVGGKVYHFGGIHVGSYFCGTMWLIYLCVVLYDNYQLQSLFYLTCVHTAVLFVISCVSLPALRRKWHNMFERGARLGNWLALLLLWGETWLYWQAQGTLAWYVPCALLLLTWHTALPWLRLRKVKVSVTTPSRHVALLRFDYGITPFAGSSTDISLNPLWEWHAFANVPSPKRQGFRLTVSRAGDWTGDFIDRQPTHVWVKGVPTAGVGNIEKLFQRVLWVATGSGVGPCLPHLLSQKVSAHLVWATRQPRTHLWR